MNIKRNINAIKKLKIPAIDRHRYICLKIHQFYLSHTFAYSELVKRQKSLYNSLYNPINTGQTIPLSIICSIIASLVFGLINPIDKSSSISWFYNIYFPSIVEWWEIYGIGLEIGQKLFLSVLLLFIPTAFFIIIFGMSIFFIIFLTKQYMIDKNNIKETEYELSIINELLHTNYPLSNLEYKRRTLFEIQDALARFNKMKQNRIGDSRMKTWIKVLISLVFIFILACHLFVPALNLDSIAITLLAFSALPWVIWYIKILEINGLARIELFSQEEKADIKQKADKAGLSGTALLGEANATYSFTKYIYSDPKLAMAGLRMELEHCLQKIAEHNALNMPTYVGVTQLTNHLLRQNIISANESALLRDLTSILNRAIHNRLNEKDVEAANWVFEYGVQLLDSLNSKLEAIQL